MNIKDLKPLTNQECQELNGGFWPAIFIGASIILTTLPMFKSMWNASSGSFSLPGGAGATWGEEKTILTKNSKDALELKKSIARLEDKIQHLIPPFYEF